MLDGWMFLPSEGYSTPHVAIFSSKLTAKPEF